MYALIECMERELSLTMYDTLKDAQDAMRYAFEEAGEGEDEELGETMAWKNDANNHMDFDWQIVELKDVCRKK